MNKKNIDSVIKSKLCNSCGACSVVCKTDSIEFHESIAGHYLPHIDKQSCTNCGLCYQVCPGLYYAKDKMNVHRSIDYFSGECKASYVGKAKSLQVLDNAQSGGIVTALAINALEAKTADAVICASMEWGNPSRPKIIIARTPKELISSQKSIYCPISNLKILKEIIGTKQRIIFIGTSCQIHGLLNLMKYIPSLRRNVVLKIGLICDRVMTYAALDYLVFKTSSKGITIRHHLTFRDKACGGYPGNVHVQYEGNKGKTLSANLRMGIKEYFTPARCRICFDKMNVFSDISVGDPHGLEDIDRKKGESIFIARTKVGQAAIIEAIDSQAIVARHVLYQDILKGQFIKEKRIQWASYIEAWKSTIKDMPFHYDFISRYAPTPNRSNEYEVNLHYSLALDDFGSRTELLRYVHGQLRRKKFLSRISYPIRLLKRAIKRADLLSQ